MLNFSVTLIIITIGALWSSINCADQVIFRKNHAVEERLTKQQNKQKKAISCPTPRTSKDKIFTVYDLDDEPITNLSTWSQIPKFFYLTSQCSGGYSLLDGNNTYSSYCSPKGDWEPYLKPCLRVCPTLHIPDVDLTCKDKRLGSIDCNGPLLSGSQVVAKCKPNHHAGSESQPDHYDSMRCKDDGRWNKENFNCVQDCGKPVLQPLIANGEKSKFGEFPWHTAIYYVPKNYLLICGGTLITTNVVLSAAHCFFDEIKGVPKRDPKNYVIVVGKTTRDYNNSDSYVQKKYEDLIGINVIPGGADTVSLLAFTLSSIFSPLFQPPVTELLKSETLNLTPHNDMYQVSEILFSEREYNPSINGYSYDIAIIILKENVTLSPYVLPACFRRHGSVGFNPGKNNTRGAVPGWGRDENNILSTTLKFARLDYVDYKECALKKVAGVTLDKFCAGADNGPRPLKGDSGGGIVFKIGTLYYIRGIVSARDTSSYSSITIPSPIFLIMKIGSSPLLMRDQKTTPFSTLSTPTRTSTKKIVDHTTPSRTRVTSFRPTSPPQKPSLQEPLYIQIIKKKCVDYAEARFQNMCSKGSTTDGAKNCSRVMDCKRVETLIVGGTDASEKEFPHMALIGYVRNDTEDDDEIIWLCGGTLISESFILTAAHCLADHPNYYLPKWILLGTVDRTNLTLKEMQKNRLPTIGKIYIHPGYKNGLLDHNIALIQLTEPVKFSARIRPVCLHTDYDIPKKYINDATVLGWGKLGAGMIESDTLQKATVRFFSNILCLPVYANETRLKNGFDNKTMICAGDKDSERDTCAGDSGGPIQIRHEMECMYVQVGITSTGSYFCGDGEPSIYTRISSYLDWIQKIVWPSGSDH